MKWDGKRRHVRSIIAPTVEFFPAAQKLPVARNLKADVALTVKGKARRGQHIVILTVHANNITEDGLLCSWDSTWVLGVLDLFLCSTAGFLNDLGESPG